MNNAGILFYDEKTDAVLTGFQARGWGGFGGKEEAADEGNMKLTAAREVIEELYDFSPRYQERINVLIKFLSRQLGAPIIDTTNRYYLYVADYDLLDRLIKRVFKCGVRTPHYNKIPNTIAELINNRINIPGEEISQVASMTITEYRNMNAKKSRYFLWDLAHLSP